MSAGPLRGRGCTRRVRPVARAACRSLRHWPGNVPAVVAPGPGDDIGDVTVFADGLALFESDSGDLTTWLTREQRTYNWVC